MIDIDSNSEMQIRVEARDSGVPTWLSTDMDLTIYVRDVNDYPARFQVDMFQVNLTGTWPSVDHADYVRYVNLSNLL